MIYMATSAPARPGPFEIATIFLTQGGTGSGEVPFPSCVQRRVEISANPKPPFAEQQQPMPGSSAAMVPQPDYGETSYEGHGRLSGKKAVITGADSGIGRAVALAFAREGADVLVSYYNEHEDAKETQRLVESAGRTLMLMAGDIKDPQHCRTIIDKAVATFGQIDVQTEEVPVAQKSARVVEESRDPERGDRTD
jgi:hypothetical protein